jgi:spermidine synthase
VNELLVVDALDTVIHWHQEEKVPLGKVLNADPRCRYVLGSFFDLAVSDGGFDSESPGRRFDAILLDIDHSPRALLNESNASFYTTDSLGKMARYLRSGGVFAMWSNDPPDEPFMDTLGELFVEVEARVVSFYNPFQNRESTNTVYLATKSGA